MALKMPLSIALHLAIAHLRANPYSGVHLSGIVTPLSKTNA